MSKNSEPGLFDEVKPQGDLIARSNSATQRPPPPRKPVTIRARRVPFNERLTCTVAEACDAAGLGRTKLYELFEGDMIESCTVGRRRLVKVPSLLKFLGMKEP